MWAEIVGIYTLGYVSLEKALNPRNQTNVLLSKQFTLKGMQGPFTRCSRYSKVLPGQLEIPSNRPCPWMRLYDSSTVRVANNDHTVHHT